MLPRSPLPAGISDAPALKSAWSGRRGSTCLASRAQRRLWQRLSDRPRGMSGAAMPAAQATSGKGGANAERKGSRQRLRPECRPELRQHLAGLAVQVVRGEPVERRGRRVGLDETCAAARSQLGQRCRRINHRGRTDAEEYIAGLRRIQRRLPGIFGQRLAEPDDAGADASVAVRAAWRLEAPASG